MVEETLSEETTVDRKKLKRAIIELVIGIALILISILLLEPGVLAGLSASVAVALSSISLMV